MAAKSAGGRLAPGRPVIGLRPRSTRFCSFSGKPPGGSPSRPSKNSTTDSGNANSRGPSITSAGVRLLATMNRAMSPTTFEVGVTLTMSPNIRLTSAYMRQTSASAPPDPATLAWAYRFVYWPPGISFW